jgi:hypothetical protein
MAEAKVYGLPPGTYILWCDGRPVPITRDPATLTPAERDAACGGIGTMLVPHVKLRQRHDGHYDAQTGPE